MKKTTSKNTLGHRRQHSKYGHFKEVFIFALVMMLTMLSCGEDVREVATYEINGPSVECPGANVSDIGATFKMCDWQCVDYEDKLNKIVSLSFKRDEEGDDWEFEGAYVADNPICN